MRRLFFRVIAFFLVSTLALLGLSAGVAAKADQVVKVCGASVCMRTDDPGIVGALHSTFAPTSAPAPAPFYVVGFEDGQREVWSYIYVPSVRAMRSDAFGRGPARWQDASLIRASLPDLMRFEPNPASSVTAYGGMRGRRRVALRSLAWPELIPPAAPSSSGPRSWPQVLTPRRS